MPILNLTRAHKLKKTRASKLKYKIISITYTQVFIIQFINIDIDMYYLHQSLNTKICNIRSILQRYHPFHEETIIDRL